RLHADGIGERNREVVRLTGERTDGGELPERPTEVPRHLSRARRIAGDVDGRRHVRVDGEGARAPLLPGQQAREVAVDLADRVVRAGRVYPVTSGRCRLGAYEVVALFVRDHEERVLLCGPIRREPVEELHER